ncbi:MAG: glutamate--tRNA ligase family protein, partial [Pseudomonadota bacterium]
GSDHVTNTATQIQIIDALGGVCPTFGHHSLLTGPQGEGLSKRLGTLALRDLRARGIEPMAVLSLMARLGSSQPVELRTSIDEIAEGFDLSQFGAAPTKFDEADLGPLSARLLHDLEASAVPELGQAGIPADQAPAFWAAIRDNVETRADIAAWWALAREGATPLVDEADETFIQEALALLPAQPWTTDSWGSWTSAVKEATGRKGKGLFMPLRKALTGRERGPDMAALMPHLSPPKRP